MIIAVYCIPDYQASVSQLKCEYMKESPGIDINNPRLTWNLISKKNVTQTYYEIKVATSPELLKQGKPDMWDSGKKESAVSLAVYNGKPLESFQRYFWNVTIWNQDGKKLKVSPVASFETSMLSGNDWEAKWITDEYDKEYKPAPMLRKSFTAGKEIKKAHAYISSAGYYELFINGKRVGDRMLDPGYTHFDKRILYSTYDVTDYLRKGENVAAAVLGNGWFNIQALAVWHFEKARWRSRPQMICQLRLEYDDGSVETVISDSSWKTSTGPYLYNNLYSGDTYDARLEQPGWDNTGFDDSGWTSAIEVRQPAPLLVSQVMPPIRVTGEIAPVAIKSFGDTIHVFDIGENIAGVCRLKIKGKAGTKITLRHSEMLHEDGMINQANIDCYFQRETNDSPQQVVPGEVFQMDTYILKGGDDYEYFTPAFTYHGFRYAEVKSDRPIELSEENITALFLHTDVEPVGYFSCSNELLNKIWKATNQSYLSNLHSIPTDCPQREKNGWTADAHLSVDLGLLNFDGIKVYEKWMNDFIDNQLKPGNISGIIPSAGWGYFDIGPVWDAAMFIIPNAIYNYYGDTTCIVNIYETCRKYLDYLKTREEDGILTYGLGDWVPYKTVTPNDFTSTCFYYHDYVLMARFAGLLGKDTSPYRQKADTLKQLINRKFFNPESGIYANGSQTALSAALYFNLVPEGFEQKVTDNLVASVKANDHQLDFGVLGSKFVPAMLTKYGYVEDAYKMATKETAPSWGNWIAEKGMTTLCETWLLDPELSDGSLNHVFLGDISAWMYNVLAGINYDENDPGFRHIIIRPHFPEGLDWVKAEYRSVNGLIYSEWIRDGDRIKLSVSIPGNTRATVYADEVKEIGPGRWEYDIVRFNNSASSGFQP